MPLAPHCPTGIPGMPVGQLADFAGSEIEAMELYRAAALAVEHQVAAVRGYGGHEVVERIGIGASVGQPAQPPPGVGIGPSRTIRLA